MEELESHQEIGRGSAISHGRKLLPLLGWRNKALGWCHWSRAAKVTMEQLNPSGLSSRGSGHGITEPQAVLLKGEPEGNNKLPPLTLCFSTSWKPAKVGAQKNVACRDQRSVVESRASKGQAMDPVAKGPGEDLLVPCHLLPVPAEGPRHCHKVCPRVSGILLKLSTSHIAVLVLCLSFSFLFFFYPLGRTLYLNCHVPQSPSVPSHCLSAFLITHSAASGWISPHRPHAQ